MTYRGAYPWIRMHLGLRNSLATFQPRFNLILSDVRFKMYLVYVVDLLIILEKLEEHIKLTNDVITLQDNAIISLNIQKCELFCKSLYFQEHKLLYGRIVNDKEYNSSIDHAKFHEGMTKIQSFFGAYDIYQIFIKEFGQIAESLNRWLQKDVNMIWPRPSDEQRQAFQALQKSLVKPPVLALPVETRLFVPGTDGSEYNIDVTLF